MQRPANPSAHANDFLGVGSLYASPLVAGGHVYFAGREGTTVVIKDDETLETVSVIHWASQSTLRLLRSTINSICALGPKCIVSPSKLESLMRMPCWICLLCVASLAKFSPAADPDPLVLVKQVVSAAGGDDKLLKFFRTRETVNVSSDPEKIVPERVSVYEPPNYWWTGKTERVKDVKKPDEPAIYLVWAWTLGLLTDPASELQLIPDVVEADKPASACA